jgi:ribosomal protein S24E
MPRFSRCLQPSFARDRRQRRRGIVVKVRHERKNESDSESPRRQAAKQPLARIFHTQTKKIFGSQRSTELGHRAHRGKNNDLHSVSKRRLETKIPHTLCAPSVSVPELCALCDPCLGWFGCEIFGLATHPLSAPFFIAVCRPICPLKKTSAFNRSLSSIK